MSDINDVNENELEEEEGNYITLTDDDGNDVPFEFLANVEYEGKDYAVLLPFEAENDEEEEQLVILEVITDEESESVEFLSVEDDEVLEAVFAEFLKLLDEEEEAEEQ